MRGHPFRVRGFFDFEWRAGARRRASRATILGHAMAHEIGHLLLRTSAHAHVGIMRAYWDLQELREAAQRSLYFTPEQAELMRAEVLARTAEQEQVSRLAATR